MKNTNTFEGQDFPSSSVVLTDSITSGFSNAYSINSPKPKKIPYKRKAPKKLWEIVESHAGYCDADNGHGMDEKETDNALLKFLKSL